jgi:hypothetical protein
MSFKVPRARIEGFIAQKLTPVFFRHKEFT